MAGLLAALPVGAVNTELPSGTSATEPRFDIWEYEIDGNSVLPIEAIERAVQPHLGPGQSMKAVETARTALEAAYQQAGFLTVLVDIPEQRVDEGVVRLSVLEGKVGTLYVAGSRYHSQGYIRRTVTALQEGSVPNFTVAQQQLGALNRSDDRRVVPVVKPGRLPGTVDMELQVTDQLPIGGSLELNNNHSAGTTDTRASATLRYDNLFQRDHSLALTLQTAPEAPDESRVLVANYTVPEPDGDAWGLSFTLSNSNVETLGGTQALGKGKTFGLRHHHNLQLGGAAGTVSLGADLKYLKDRLAFGTSVIDTPIRYMPFQAAYTGLWSEGRESLQLNTSLTFAWRRILQRELDCVGTRQDQFDCKTQGASGSFGVFRLDGRWTRPWGDSSLVTRLAGQLASGPLVSAEQYTLGGAETIRGYLEGEVSADHAILGSLEWRGPNLVGAQEPAAGWTDVRPLLYIDLGRGHLAHAGAGQASYSSLYGGGFGLRLSSAWLDAALDAAWPGKTTPNTAAGEPRVHVRVTARY
ncbi:ShlB/FhaC/HecB family hemolysin secretion/activation protein [Ideonella sp. DXS29W]|uniref:ShlB/FhaC/HecB family hemolysin secretion/activation protein n=1 Tax=Ideonella lacteola TaxID=2984193 RepID=A0ABU9BRV3_9BURK